MPVNRIILRTMFISAGVCGLSGMIQASGADKTLTDSVAGGDGFTAIIVAWLARLSPVGILIVAVMFGVLEKGCASVETVYKISSEFFGILQGIILFFVLGVEFFITVSRAAAKRRLSDEHFSCFPVCRRAVGRSAAVSARWVKSSPKRPGT